MKKDKLLFIFIFIAIVGIVLINFVYPNYFKKKEINYSNEIKIQGQYKANVVLKGLVDPTSFAMDKDNNIFVSENIKDKGRIIKYTPEGKYSEFIQNIASPVSYIIFHRDELYISQKGAISKLENGEIKDIINGLPSLGDYTNNGIAFGYDGMIYVCQGAATNSGVVGIDNYENGWLIQNPFFHDYPPVDCILGGINFRTKNPLNVDKNSRSNTGAFLPFNSISLQSEAIKGRIPGNACIFRISPNGSIMDIFSWGIKNPMSIIILPDTRVFISAQGMEDRGSRPIANGKDYIYEIKKGDWLGWPDYEGGDPVILNKFSTPKHSPPQFIMELHPTTNPVKPIQSFNESGRIGIMDISTNGSFGLKGQLIIPLKKGKHEDAKLVALDLKNNKVIDFITNKDNSNFLENPVQCSFSKDGKLYILEKTKGLLIEVSPKNENSKTNYPGSISTEYFLGTIIIAFILYLIFTIRLKK